MLDTFNKLLDWLFPPRESQLLLRTDKSRPIPIQTDSHAGIFFCTTYTNPIIRAAIVENKFYNSRPAQLLLADRLSAWLQANHLTEACFIPIPLGPERQRKRGHNQVVSILQNCDYSFLKNLLVRSKETVPQASLDRQQRLRNIKNIFVCNEQKLAQLTGRTIILFDDVVTTGATLNEARATLAPHLPSDCKLICLALAH